MVSIPEKQRVATKKSPSTTPTTGLASASRSVPLERRLAKTPERAPGGSDSGSRTNANTAAASARAAEA